MNTLLRFRTISLSLLAVVAVTFGLNIATTSVATASTCPTYQFIGVRGSGETNGTGDGYGVPVNAFRKAMAGKIAGGEYKFIDYPAIPVAPLDPHYKSNYRLSINAGINTLSSFISAFHTRCQTTPIVLAGYSQGAHVAGDVYQTVNPGTHDKTTLVMFGDPRFNPAQTKVNVGNYDAGRHGIWSTWFTGLSNTARSFGSDDYASVHSYCLKFDPVCNYTTANAINCAPNFYCVHTKYIEFGYTDDAAKWAEGRVRGMMPAPPAANPAPPSVHSYTYHVANTGGIRLRVRPGPAAVGTPVDSVAPGGTLNIVCQAHGQRVLPGSDIWDRLATGGWVYDWYTTTPNIGVFSPPIPVC